MRRRGVITAIAGAGRPAVYIGGEIYTRPSFGANHPLSYTRQGAVEALCRALGWLPPEVCRTAPQASPETLRRLHHAAYIGALKSASERGSVTRHERETYRFGTMENPMFAGLFERAASTVGGSMLAAQLALEGAIAFHPAGGTHHGRPDRASGFCYFNDPAFAILAFLDAGLDRVLYVDVDAHHGDGVFDAFAADSRVACISVHEEDRWPNTGTLGDQGERSLNVPVPQGVTDTEYGAILDQLVMPFAERFGPQGIVVTCGADALHGDPLSRMELSNNALWDAVLRFCGMDVPTVVLGGGGYNPWTTVRCWSGLWGLLSRRAFPCVLPPDALRLLEGFDSDLVDDDELEPYWLDRIADPPMDSALRPEVTERIAALAKVHFPTRAIGRPIH